MILKVINDRVVDFYHEMESLETDSGKLIKLTRKEEYNPFKHYGQDPDDDGFVSTTVIERGSGNSYNLIEFNGKLDAKQIGAIKSGKLILDNDILKIKK